MLGIKELAQTIERTYYILMVIEEYCRKYASIDEVLPIIYSMNLLTKDLDKIYAKIINEKILSAQ